MRFSTALLLFALTTSVEAGGFSRTCRRGWWCWPSDTEVAAFRAALNPEMNRTIANVPGEPWEAPYATEIDGLPTQPLYGLGLEQMEPLYVKPDPTADTCTANGTFASDFCKAQVTAEPVQSADADFVVFVLTVEHIRTALRFAVDHKLCISVTGTGHDLMGRNQPNHCGTGGSILIRTTLMQSLEADLEDEAGLGSASFRFGPGVGMSKAQAFAADHGHLIVSGWCESVGIVGWTIGGGMGPVSPRYGLGPDNLLAADVMLADGTVVTAKATGKYSDLYTALRGGGGSTWGIITSITMKAHPTPESGFVVVTAASQGSLCDTTGLRTMLQDLADLQTSFNEKQSARTLFVSSYPDAEDCSTSSFQLVARFMISDNMTSDETQQILDFIAARPSYIASLAVAYDTLSEAGKFSTHLFASEQEFVLINVPPAYSLANALVQREDNDAVVDYMMDVALNTTYSLQTLSPCLLGQHGAYESTGTSMSEAMRTALYRYLIAVSDKQDDLREKFGTQVYFAESSRDITDFAKAYWGYLTYFKLLLTKFKYDPTRVFGCFNCV